MTDDAKPRITVGGVEMINIGTFEGKPLVRIAGRARTVGVLLGDVTKSEARKLRKAFYQAGWSRHAACKRLGVPKGWKRWTSSIEISFSEDEYEFV